MDKKDKEVLIKIKKHAEEIVQETQKFNNAIEFKNSNDSKAALFDLIQIGELAKNGLSIEAANELTTIPWAEIYGLRNRIVHGYAEVDFLIIFQTIKNDIPALITEVTIAIQNLDNSLKETQK